MTRRTNGRIAGAAFLLYIALGIGALVFFGRATKAQGTAAKLVQIAEHASDVRVAILLSLVCCFAAVVLGVTLYGITRDEDNELAMFGLTCRVAEGVVGSVGLISTLGLLWLATAADARAQTPDSMNAVGAFLLQLQDWIPTISAIFFAVGSTIFCYLFVRGRIVPIALAWLGVIASLLLVVLLPFRLAGFFGGAMFNAVWAPMAVFEIVLALWLLIKGVAEPARE